ncbi:MAG: hypothetical protein FJ109_17555, partial [Deltaproteobacteria bacterium]|nr:hypothetical protein [Deltaproteobacteria bacterium]
MKDTTLRRALPPLLILLAILPATTSAVVAGRLGSTGGEAVHILGEPESGLYTESDLRRLPDPGAAVPAFLLELVGSDLVSLRRVQAACLALALLLLFLTTASVGLPPVAVLTFAAL